MEERKLASIQKILTIEPIPNADKIDKASVLGWELVVQKNEFKVGDLCIYCEVDSILPEKPEFEFLRDRHFRIKTIKLKKQIAQGIAFPLSILPMGDYFEGQDVTDIIGVKKYDSEEKQEQEAATKKPTNWLTRYLMRYRWFRKIFKRKKNVWPDFVSHTDEERIQNIPWICQKCKDLLLYATEKLDGTSATYFLKRGKRKLFGGFDYEFGVCSRKLRLPGNRKTGKSHYWEMAEKYDIEKILRIVLDLEGLETIAIQGEIIGEGIQGNKYKIKGHDFFAFNLYFNGQKINIHHCKLPGFKLVPLLDYKFKIFDTIQEMVKFSRGKSMLCDCNREGIVLRNYENNISFKVIDPGFLLENDE